MLSAKYPKLAVLAIGCTLFSSMLVACLREPILDKGYRFINRTRTVARSGIKLDVEIQFQDGCTRKKEIIKDLGQEEPWGKCTGQHQVEVYACHIKKVYFTLTFPDGHQEQAVGGSYKYSTVFVARENANKNNKGQYEYIVAAYTSMLDYDADSKGTLPASHILNFNRYRTKEDVQKNARFSKVIQPKQ